LQLPYAKADENGGPSKAEKQRSYQSHFYPHPIRSQKAHGM
jgi:hypothetical protein